MNRYKFDAVHHIHLLDNKPLFGTSTVSNTMPKNLSWWAAEHAAVTCLETGEKIPTIRAEYLEAIASPNKKNAIYKLQKKYPLFKKARFAHYVEMKDKAEKGTDLHAELERFINWRMAHIHGIVPDTFDKKILPFIEWSNGNVQQFLWSEAHCYSEKLWTGGIIDAGAELNDGKIALIDFKSAKEVYLSHWLQCAGYAIEVEENGLFDSKGNVIPINFTNIDQFIVVPFGAREVKPVINPLPLSEYKEGFIHAVGLHKLVKRSETLAF